MKTYPKNFTYLTVTNSQIGTSFLQASSHECMSALTLQQPFEQRLATQHHVLLLGTVAFIIVSKCTHSSVHIFLPEFRLSSRGSTVKFVSQHSADDGPKSPKPVCYLIKELKPKWFMCQLRLHTIFPILPSWRAFSPLSQVMSLDVICNQFNS